MICNPLLFAERKHTGQLRKNGEPFIHHLIRVEAYARYYITEYSQELISSVAFLHDTIEDTDTSYNEVVSEFGTEIADYVVDLTNVYVKDKYPKMRRKERKSREAERLGNCCDFVQQMKLADRLENIVSMAHIKDDYWKNRYIDETKELIKHIGGANEKLNEAINQCLGNYYLLLSM